MYNNRDTPPTKPEDFYPPYDGRTETYSLGVDLSPKELEERRLRLGQVSSERAKLATKHAEAQAKWKEEHKDLESEFASLCEQLGTGKELRDIECEWELDPKKKTVSLRRLDSKELVFKNYKLPKWQFDQLSQENLLDRVEKDEGDPEEAEAQP